MQEQEIQDNLTGFQMSELRVFNQADYSSSLKNCKKENL
jgi:hypothetical protein